MWKAHLAMHLGCLRTRSSAYCRMCLVFCKIELLSHKNISYIKKYSRCPFKNHILSIIPSHYVFYIQKQTLEIYCEQCKRLFYIYKNAHCGTFKRQLKEKLRKVSSSEKFWSKLNFCLASCKQKS